MRGFYIGCLMIASLILCSNKSEAKNQSEPIRFKDSSSAELKGKIKGYEDIDYHFAVKKGQAVVIDLKSSNLSSYFNVLPPRKEEALFVGSTSGNHFEAQLSEDGVYTIRVYLMRSAARRGETSIFRLKLSLSKETDR